MKKHLLIIIALIFSATANAQSSEYEKKAKAMASVSAECAKNEKIVNLTEKADPVSEAKRLAAGGLFVDKNFKIKAPISVSNLLGTTYKSNPSNVSATLEVMNFGTSGNTVLLTIDSTEEPDNKTMGTFSWSGKDVHVAPAKDQGAEFFAILRGNTRLGLLGKFEGYSEQVRHSLRHF